MFLNKTLQLCSETDAAFQSVSHPPDRARDVLDDQSLEAFNSEVTTTAELRSQTLPIDPIGRGDDHKKWKTEIGGLRFHWHHETWEHEWDGHCIKIHPNVDRTEVEIFLKTFNNFKKGVFTRSRIQNEPMLFILGATDTHAEKCVASARVRIRGKSRPGEIRLPFCKNGHHLIANQVGAVLESQGFQDGLRGILLHEIGHTLKRDFPDEREHLRKLTSDEWELIMPMLDQISPHYLGKQKQEILESIQLKELVTRLPDLSKQERLTAQTKLKEHTEKIGAELFAEMGRYFYLEPCINQTTRPTTKTGLPAFDNFAEILREGANINRTREDATFPSYRGPEFLD